MAATCYIHACVRKFSTQIIAPDGAKRTETGMKPVQRRLVAVKGKHNLRREIKQINK